MAAIDFTTLPPGLNPMSIFNVFVQADPATNQIPTSQISGTQGCSQRQWRAALSANGYLNTVFATISNDINDAVNMQWSAGLLVIENDALWQATQSALIAKYGAFTNQQMLALLAQAQTLPF